MANTPTTTMRLDPELKDQAMKVLEPLGLNMTGAVTIFLKAVVRENGMPFELKAQPREGRLAVFCQSCDVFWCYNDV